MYVINAQPFSKSIKIILDNLVGRTMLTAMIKNNVLVGSTRSFIGIVNFFFEVVDFRCGRLTSSSGYKLAE